MWVGLALSLSIFWDAAIDPWIGRFSDRFREQFGTRLHLVLIGAIASSILLVALYTPPTFSNPKSLWLYLFVVSLFFNTAYTFFSIPYTAMVGDYTNNRIERSQFIAWRFVFANLGAIAGIAIPGYYLAKESTDVYQQASWLIATIVLGSAFIGSLAPPAKLLPGTKPTTPQMSVFKELLLIRKSRPLLLLLSAYFVVNIGLTFNNAAALYFYRLRLQLEEAQIQNLLLLFLIIFSFSVPLWVVIGKKWGRKPALIWGALLLGISQCLTFPLLPPGNANAAYFWAAIVGGVLVGSYVLLESVLTDVVDYNTVKTRQESFGLFFGVWKFAAKFSRAMALLLTGTLLEWANVTFPDVDTPFRLSLIFGPAVGLFFICAGLLIIPLGLTETKVAQIKRILDRRTQKTST